MNTRDAYMMGVANQGKPLMVFDWDKAALAIKRMKPTLARAGLRGDWEWTGGIIYKDDKPTTSYYTYLASTWAVPELEIDGEVMPCYRMEDEAPKWNAKTKWPKSAREILERQEQDGE